MFIDFGRYVSIAIYFIIKLTRSLLVSDHGLCKLRVAILTRPLPGI